MKLRIEIDNSGSVTEEVIIRCRSVDERVLRLQNALSEILDRGTDLLLTLGETEYYIPIDEILFFETDDGRVTAHTAERMYYSDKKLYELEALLPRCFTRVSKSALVNCKKINSVGKGISGNGEVTFAGSQKKTYVSRLYFKSLKETIYEMRLSK